MNKVSKGVLLFVGILALGLGMAGLILPVLPATPFFMLAAFAFARSSDKLNRWMRSKAFIARRLESIEQGRGLSPKDKLGIYAFALVLILPLMFFTSSLHLRLFLGGLLTVKAVFFILWNPQRKQRRASQEQADSGHKTPEMAGTARTKKSAVFLLAMLGILQSLGNVVLYALLARTLVDQGLIMDLWFWAGILALGIKLLAGFFFRRLMPRVSADERRLLRRSIMELAWDSLDRLKPLDPGTIMSLGTEGVESLTLYRGLYLPQLLVGILAPFLIVGTMALADGFTALVLLGLIPLTPLLVGSLQARFRKASAAYREVNGRLINRYEEGLLGLTTLKTAGHSKAWGERIAQAATEHRKAAMGLLVVNQLLILFLDLSASLGLTFVAAWFSWTRLGQGLLGPFDALFITLASLELIRPQQLMGAFFFAGGLGRNTLKAVRQIRTEAEPNTPPTTNPRPMPTTRPQVLEARDLAFQYPGTQLKDPCGLQLPGEITLKPGRLLGLLGTSGSGKTTLRRLMAGLLVPKGGQILVDGQDCTGDQAYLRSLVAVADQHPYLFTGSVAENLRYACPGASDTALWEVLGSVGLDTMPSIAEHGLAAPVGEEGRLLSGGQRSRLSLARALLRDCPFLILDEPSADLDPGTEALVLQLSRELSLHRAVMIISHRQGLLAGADLCLAMPQLEEACLG